MLAICTNWKNCTRASFCDWNHTMNPQHVGVDMREDQKIDFECNRVERMVSLVNWEEIKDE